MATLSTRITHGLLVLVLLALLAIISMLATGVRGGPLDPTSAPGSTDSVRLPGTPISGTTTIDTSGNYYVTRNIFASGTQAAITIAVSSVTLDLGGFAIVGSQDATLGVHIDGGGNDNIVIRNGILRDHLIGINADFGTQVTIDNVHVYSNVVGIELGSDSVVRNSNISRNSVSGLVVVSDDNYVHDNLIANNNVSGTPGGADIGVNGRANILARNVAPGDPSDDTIGTIVVAGDYNFMDGNSTNTLEFTIQAGSNDFIRGRACFVLDFGGDLNYHPNDITYENTGGVDIQWGIPPERNRCGL